MSLILFQTIDWENVEKTVYPGLTGTAYWQVLQFENIRVRMVEYSAGYMADHWCQKGHIVHCVEGSFTTEMENGSSFLLEKGMSYIVSDDASSHRSVTKDGAKLLIIDGNFLQ